MDGETERKIAALILAEAQRLKARAAEEGVRAYLKPHVRYRPNSQFLRATVQSVEYANRVADVNEMWKEREVELAESRRETRGDSAERPMTSRDARGGGSVGEARRTQRSGDGWRRERREGSRDDGHWDEKRRIRDDEEKGWRRGEEEGRAWRRGKEEEEGPWRGGGKHEMGGEDRNRGEDGKRGDHERRGGHERRGEHEKRATQRRKNLRTSSGSCRQERQILPLRRGQRGSSREHSSDDELEAQRDRGWDAVYGEKRSSSPYGSDSAREKGRFGNEGRGRSGGRGNTTLWEDEVGDVRSDKREGRKGWVGSDHGAKWEGRRDVDGEMGCDEDCLRRDRPEFLGEDDYEEGMRDEGRGGRRSVRVGSDGKGRLRFKENGHERGTFPDDGPDHQYGDDYLERRGREPVEDYRRRYGGRHETEERRVGQEKEQRLDGTCEYDAGIGDGPVQGNGHREMQRRNEHKKRPGQDDGEGVGMGSWSDADAEQKGIDDSDLLTFLKTKVKRGRGAIGSRADAWGSELPSLSAGMGGGAEEGSGAVSMLLARVREEWEDSVVAGKGRGLSASWAASGAADLGAAGVAGNGQAAGRVGGASAGGADGRWIRGVALDEWPRYAASGGAAGSSGSGGSSSSSSGDSRSDSGDTGSLSSESSSSSSERRGKRRKQG